MTPIEILLSLELPDAVIARRLQVSPVAVCYWRTGRRTPSLHHQDVARVYLAELQAKITQGLLSSTVLRLRAG